MNEELFCTYVMTKPKLKISRFLETPLKNLVCVLKPIDYGNDTDIIVGSNSNDTRTGGGQLLIQCGWYGNLQEVISILERITQSDRFKVYFADWKQSWARISKTHENQDVLSLVTAVATLRSRSLFFKPSFRLTY